ncbi:hypothetical protein VTK73DRAFT_1608 [Phialemonium thermophilum]|uniref:Telomeric single stranded DNA binding POT1/Cdc13 domain-containing protein n=1 Tax=Phialemonium thermophilum TaxID=223376 RepID=A0ABR3Y329_9PEZI
MGSAQEGFALPDSVIRTPISQLSPDLGDQSTRVVVGEVTILWPFNSVARSLAFLLAEPDILLRRNKGQVRVQLSGSSARLVADWKLGGGDRLALSLDGVKWGEDESLGRGSESRLRWQLEFDERLKLQARVGASAELKRADIDHPPTVHEEAHQDIVDAPNDSVPADILSPVSDPFLRQAPEVDAYELKSPAFLKRARVSYGSLLEGDGDIFGEDEGRWTNGRKRARFGRGSSIWRYASKSPSPESQPEPEPESRVEQAHVPGVDAGTQSSPIRESSPGLPSSMVPTENHSRPPNQQPTEVEGTTGTLDERHSPQRDSEHGLSPVPPPKEEKKNVPEPPNATAPSVRQSSVLFGNAAPGHDPHTTSWFSASAPPTAETGLNIADRVRFGFSHQPDPGLALHHQTQPSLAPSEHRSGGDEPFPGAHSQEPPLAKYAEMETYVDAAEEEVELQSTSGLGVPENPPVDETFERDQWDMATQSPDYNRTEGGHFGIDALEEGTRITTGEAALRSDEITPDAVPPGFDSYGGRGQGASEHDESPDEEENSDESDSGEELVENDEVEEESEDEVGVTDEDDAQYDEDGEELEQGDYDQRQYEAPSDDEEGLSDAEHEVVREIADRYSEQDIMDSSEDDSEEERSSAIRGSGHRTESEEQDGYEDDEEEDDEEEEEEEEEEENEYRPWIPGTRRQDPVPKNPVVISLLSDSEDESDDEQKSTAPKADQPLPVSNDRHPATGALPAEAQGGASRAHPANGPLENRDNHTTATDQDTRTPVDGVEDRVENLPSSLPTGVEVKDFAIGSKEDMAKQENGNTPLPNGTESGTDTQPTHEVLVTPVMGPQDERGGLAGSERTNSVVDQNVEVGQQLRQSTEERMEIDGPERLNDEDLQTSQPTQSISVEHGAPPLDHLLNGHQASGPDVSSTATPMDVDVPVLEGSSSNSQPTVESQPHPPDEDTTMPDTAGQNNNKGPALPSSPPLTQPAESRVPIAHNVSSPVTDPTPANLKQAELPPTPTETQPHLVSPSRLPESTEIVSSDIAQERTTEEAPITSSQTPETEEEKEPGANGDEQEPVSEPVAERTASEPGRQAQRDESHEGSGAAEVQQESLASAEPHAEVEEMGQNAVQQVEIVSQVLEVTTQDGDDVSLLAVQEADTSITTKPAEESPKLAQEPSESEAHASDIDNSQLTAGQEDAKAPDESAASSFEETVPQQAGSSPTKESVHAAEQPSQTRSGRRRRSQVQDVITVKPRAKGRKTPGPPSKQEVGAMETVVYSPAAPPAKKVVPKNAPSEAPRSPMKTRARSGSLRTSVTPDRDESVEQPVSSAAAPTAEISVDIEAKSASPSAPKPDVSKQLRKALPGFSTLKALKQHNNKRVKVAAVVTTQPPAPQRAKRQYSTAFRIADYSVAPNQTVEVQFSHAHKDYFPLVQSGDAIVLRDFEVVTLGDRDLGLRNVDDSSWSAVTRDGHLESRGQQPVKLSEAEAGFAQALRSWYSSLNDGARSKLDNASHKAAEGSATK